MSESRVRESAPLSAERLKVFTDAVVAIAMTLLILPLLDSISDAQSAEYLTGFWLAGEAPQLFAFVLSFVLIANFWMTHHRLFDRVERVTNALVWLTIAWMFTIVWLPVATALLGQLDVDAVQEVVYIGSLLAASLVLLVTRVYIRRHPELHSIPDESLREGMQVSIITSLLFVAALVVALVFPAVNYWAMFLLLLTAPLHRLISRRRHS